MSDLTAEDIEEALHTPAFRQLACALLLELATLVARSKDNRRRAARADAAEVVASLRSGRRRPRQHVGTSAAR